MVKIQIVLFILLTSFNMLHGQSNDAFEKIDQLMKENEAKGFNGGIVVVEKGKILIAKGYGFSDIESKIPFDTATIAPIGSLVKSFTAAAILKLEMQNKINTEDYVSKYIKDWPADKATIKLHHLLTHSAGFPLYYKPIEEGIDMEKFSKQEFIMKVKKPTPLFTPGSKNEYSNVGYSLLAYIIEEVSGMSYEAYLKKNLFDPFGIHLGYILQPWLKDTKKIAVGYLDGKRWGTFYEKYGNNNGNPSWNLIGNGALHGSIMDMYRWDQALRGTALLSKEAKEKYFKQHMQETDSDEFIAYGNMVNKVKSPDRKGEEFISAMGGSNGVFSAVSRRWLDRDRMIYMVGTNNQNMVFNIWRGPVRMLNE